TDTNFQHVLLFSVGGAFGGNRGARPIPPEKGVFPLDHLHECDLEKKEYVACLKSSGFQSEKCRHFSKKYLECRMMERNLMAKQDMSELGFGKEDERDPYEESNIKINNQYNPSTEKKKIAP
ncbi:cytochrome c oxidase assembly protein COX19-like, partial [Ananas comosus]|uniref:Cytochrome c oxidase assembly protein COX19-like n=1 Tax=Ananas comosus TaxID=4615 RepID=A0A6P5GE61_ANACO